MVWSLQLLFNFLSFFLFAHHHGSVSELKHSLSRQKVPERRNVHRTRETIGSARDVWLRVARVQRAQCTRSLSVLIWVTFRDSVFMPYPKLKEAFHRIVHIWQANFHPNSPFISPSKLNYCLHSVEASVPPLLDTFSLVRFSLPHPSVSLAVIWTLFL